MEERDMKILAGRILKGDFDEELEAAQKIQHDENMPFLEVCVRKDLFRKVDELMKGKGFSFEAFAAVALERLVQEKEEQADISDVSEISL